MIVVLEGTDCAGKTTLADAYESKLTAATGRRVTRLKRGPLRSDPLTEYLVPLEDGYTRHMVLDRWHVGELVYGPRRRGESKLTHGQAAYIELVLTAMGSQRVLVTAPCDTLVKRYEQRGDPVTTIDELCAIQTDFIGYMRERPQLWHRWDAEWMHSCLDDLIELGLVATQRKPFPRWYVGSTTPMVLLLGDVRNPLDANTPLPWPFVPWRSTSGYWMFNALAEHDTQLIQRIGVMNACERTPSELRSIWRLLERPPVVALGNNAADAAVRAEVPLSAKTNHPQHWRRFRYRDSEQFVDAIRSVL